MGEALKARAMVPALLAAAFLAILALAAAPGAKAATVNEEFEVEFNHVGVNVGTALGGINELILKPGETDPTSGDPLPPLLLKGKYTSTSGAFTVPKEGGLVFPKLNLNISTAALEGELGLEEDATGSYDEATGAMTLNSKISLTIGVSDVAALPIPGLGTGPLRCKVAPLEIAFSTSNGWPAPGDTFTPGGTFTDGALAGAFISKPGVTAVQGAQGTCTLIGNLLEPVGGIWLANKATTLTSLPEPTEDRPCEKGKQLNSSGVCAAPVVTPPTQPRGAVLGNVSFAKKKATAKRGKTVSLVVRVGNTGDAAGVATVALSSSSKAVKVPKSVRVNAPAGGTGQATVRIKAGKKKGKVTITARLAGKSTKATITVR